MQELLLCAHTAETAVLRWRELVLRCTEIGPENWPVVCAAIQRQPEVLFWELVKRTFPTLTQRSFSLSPHFLSPPSLAFQPRLFFSRSVTSWNHFANPHLTITIARLLPSTLFDRLLYGPHNRWQNIIWQFAQFIPIVSNPFPVSLHKNNYNTNFTIVSITKKKDWIWTIPSANLFPEFSWCKDQ